MAWVEREVPITVDASLNETTNIVSYRLWDIDHEIPPPEEVDDVEVFLEDKWQRMYFNRVSGKNLDPVKEGT